MKKLFYALLVMQVLILTDNCSYAQYHNLKSVKAEFVGFYTESISDISCEEFYYVFNDGEKKTKSLSDRSDLSRLQSLLNDFKLVKAKRSFDVRGVIFFNYGNANYKYCFDVFGNFYKDGKFYYNKPLLIYLSDKIFSHHPEYLDTLRQQ